MVFSNRTTVALSLAKHMLHMIVLVRRFGDELFGVACVRREFGFYFFYCKILHRKRACTECARKLGYCRWCIMALSIIAVAATVIDENFFFLRFFPMEHPKCLNHFISRTHTVTHTHQKSIDIFLKLRFFLSSSLLFPLFFFTLFFFLLFASDRN